MKYSKNQKLIIKADSSIGEIVAVMPGGQLGKARTEYRVIYKGYTMTVPENTLEGLFEILDANQQDGKRIKIREATPQVPKPEPEEESKPEEKKKTTKKTSKKKAVKK